MYATVEETDTYAATYYSSSDSVRTSWMALSNADKLVMLNKAERAINELPFHGKALGAASAFPREPEATLSLQKAKEAEMELALQLVSSTTESERYALQAQGVKSFKIGDLSETYGDSASQSGIDMFVYNKVFPFLKLWLSGGYPICPTHHRR